MRVDSRQAPVGTLRAGGRALGSAGGGVGDAGATAAVGESSENCCFAGDRRQASAGLHDADTEAKPTSPDADRETCKMRTFAPDTSVLAATISFGALQCDLVQATSAPKPGWSKASKRSHFGRHAHNDARSLN